MKIFNFFSEVKHEMQETAFPSGKELRRDTGTIFSVLIFFTIFFFIGNTLISFLINLV